MDLQIVVAPVIGSVIGYSTNWLAIKMLFKPHRAYYMGKLRLPFTPGLIPRERDRIAGSLGKTVGENLLTEEVILKELTNPRITDSLKDYIVKDLLDRQFTLKGIIGQVSDEDRIKEKIFDMIKKGLGKILKNNPAFKDGVKALLQEHISRESSLESIFGDKPIDGMEKLLYDNKLEIANGICLYLVDETMAKRIKDLISKIMSEKLGGLAAMFVDPASLYESILDFVRKSLEKEENQDELVKQLSLAVRRFSGKSLENFVSEDDYEQLIDKVSDYITNQGVSLFEGEKVNQLMEGLIDPLLNMEIRVSDDIKVVIEEKIVDMYLNFARTRLPIFIEQMNISKIVEGEINSFSTEEVENLIFGIVDRELKAITWIGALLGFVMGLFTLLA